MRTARSITVLVTALLAMALTAPPVAATAAPSNPSSTPAATAAITSSSRASDTALGKRLVNRFFAILQAQDTAALDALLSPAFQVARADGSTSTKAAYLANPPVVESYALDDFVVTRFGRQLVARYSVVTTETINGEELAKDPALRLSVFVRAGDAGPWRLLAHANFNVPVRAS